MKNRHLLRFATFACVLCVTACFNPDTDKALTETNPKNDDGGIVRKEMPLTAEQKVVLKKLEKIAPRFAYNPATSKPYPEDCRDGFSPDWSKMTFTTLPYYEIDIRQFDKDDSPDKLAKSIKPSKGILFLGRYKGVPAILIDAFEIDGEWWYANVEQGEGLTKCLAWLPGRLEAADPDNYYCIPGHGWVFVLHYNGRPEFYNMACNFSDDADGMTRSLEGGKEERATRPNYFDKLFMKEVDFLIWTQEDMARVNKIGTQRAIARRMEKAGQERLEKEKK